MIFAALVGGLVGARVYYLAQNWDDVSDDLFGNLFSGLGAGLVRRRDRRRDRGRSRGRGGAGSGACGCSTWRRPALALGYAIGRIGCQLSGDGDYGEPSDLPWAMSYPDGTVPTDQEVHPTPVYETLAMGLVAWLLWQWRDRFRPGILFALYLVLSGLERFLVEFVRRNDADGRRAHDTAGREPRADGRWNRVDRGRQPPAGRAGGASCAGLAVRCGRSPRTGTRRCGCPGPSWRPRAGVPPGTSTR